jgi:energy-converting hydrogenase A subunit R
MYKHSKQYVTDCEGPISLNDNAMEMAAEFIPGGESMFAKISRYDDYLADVVKKPGYKAGDTLRLIMPFFKAYGVTNKMMRDFSRANVMFVPGAVEAFTVISAKMDAFIISTSYSPYIEALCDRIDFPFEFTYSTGVDIDQYNLLPAEEAQVKSIKSEIDGLPDDETAFPEMDRIFWDTIPALGIGALTTSVNPIGGPEKARSLEDSLMRTGAAMKDTMYVGDSITDVQAFEAARNGGGLAVSFNGNRYAIEAADVAVYGENAKILELIADEFLKGGKEAVLVLLRDLGRNIMNEIGLRGAYIIDTSNRENVIKESEEVRKKIRGMAGNLG